MLDKPNLPDETLLSCLQQAYNPGILRVDFLPLGADSNTAVYRAWDERGDSFFVRLRSGGFDPFNVTLLKFLNEQGVRPVIAPLPGNHGRLWADLDGYKVMLYPFVEGQNMYATGLSDRQWFEFGLALERLHSLVPPPDMAMRTRKERFDPVYRQSLRASLDRLATRAYEEPVARQCAALLSQRAVEIRTLIERTERLAAIVQASDLEFGLCHADLHAGNLLIEPGGDFHIIDWDEILLAPKERDLMYIGGGLLGGWRAPAEEEALFYQGYGPTQIDPVGLAYYRYERIITDLAIFARELLAVQGSREEREQSFRYMASNFDPGGVLEIARSADKV